MLLIDFHISSRMLRDYYLSLLLFVIVSHEVM